MANDRLNTVSVHATHLIAEVETFVADDGYAIISDVIARGPHFRELVINEAILGLASAFPAPTPADELAVVAGCGRQRQNLMLGAQREGVADCPRKLQDLIGYSMYRNVMGHVDRQHSSTLLGQDVAPEMVWERMDRPR